MPLKNGTSDKTRNAGKKPIKQAIAIGYSIQRAAKKKTAKKKA